MPYAVMPAVWFEVTVEVSPEFSEAVANFLVESGAPGIQYEKHDSEVSLIAYFSVPPPLEDLRRFCAAIGAPLSETAIGTRKTADEDWAQNWRLHFRPQCIGDRLYVCPPWAATPPPGRVEIVIDPGMAFGTGQHASTRGCLTLIEWALATRCAGRALDLGTGSGVLAITLVKLGVREVWAIDTDPQAVTIARGNAARNGVESHIRFASSLDRADGPLDLIVANLFAQVLEALAQRLVGLLAARGILICSGLLCSEEQRVRDGYGARGLEVCKGYEEDGWASLALQRKDRDATAIPR
jgi:ribosomal protein L11 methyltransferase